MKSLARYVRGGPLKDHGLVTCDGEQGTFRYGHQREREEQGKPQQQELTLPGQEFLARWSEHVPLPGVHMVRAWGRYASTHRRRLAQGRAQLPERDTPEQTPKVAEGHPYRDHPREQCPVCHRAMGVPQVLPRAGAPPQPEPVAGAA